MDVILLADVRGVGRRGDVKRVADGYALNYLIPNKLADFATKEKVAENKKTREAEEKRRLADAEALALAVTSLRGEHVSLVAKATEKGGLFRALVAKDVIAVLEQQKGVKIPVTALSGDVHMKTLGEHRVTIAVPGATAEVIIDVAQN